MMKIVIRAAVAGALVLLAALSGAQSTAAGIIHSPVFVVGAETNVTPSPPPDPPARNASKSEWATWAKLQRDFTMATDWKTVISNDSCEVTSTSVGPVGPDAHVPYGLVTYAVDYTFTCKDLLAPPGVGRSTRVSAPPTTSSGVAPSNASVAASIGTGTQCANVQRGRQCVGPATVSGNVHYRTSNYTLTASGYVLGHVMLANIGYLATSCFLGSGVKNSADVTLLQNQGVGTYYGPVNYSTTWEGNFWEYLGPGDYYNYGQVCTTL